MKTALPFFVAAMTVASGATAQNVEYLSYGAEYNNLSFDGDSLDLMSGMAAVDYRSGAFLVGGAFTVSRVSGEGDDLTITDIVARAGYFVSPDLVIYGGVNSLNSDASDSFTYYSVGAEYTNSALTFGLYYDDSNEDGFLSTTTLYGSYKVSDALEIAAFIGDTDGDTLTELGFNYDTGTYDVSAIFAENDGSTLFGINGAYEFGNSFRALGSFADIDGDVTAYSVGAGYQVSDDMWLDLSIGQIEADGDTLDTLGFAFTYEIGEEVLLIDRARSVRMDALGNLGPILDLGGL